MKQYHIAIDYEHSGYDVEGNIFRVIEEIWKNKMAKIVIHRKNPLEHRFKDKLEK